MKKVILLSAILLSGCLYQTVSAWDIERAEKICKAENSRVVEISADFLGYETVLCSNGKTIGLDKAN